MSKPMESPTWKSPAIGLIVSLLLIFCASVQAASINVPEDFPTIQQAIDAAADGDNVLVAPGTYFETIVMKSGVDLIGAGFSSTFIDGQGVGNGGGSIVTGADNTMIAGFTIQNANLAPFNNKGAGIDANFVTMKIRDNHIINVRIGVFSNVFSTIERNVIIGVSSNPNMTNSGIFISGNSKAIVRNNVIVNFTRGILAAQDATPDIVNNIATQNLVGIINFSSSVVLPRYNNVFENDINYSDLPDQTGTLGNVSVNPLFVDPSTRNFHLAADSPLINAGDPVSPMDPDGTRADIGLGFDVAIGAESVQSTVPEAPALMLVANDTIIQASWSAVAEATGYSLFYAPYPEAMPILSIDMGTERSISVELPVGTAFFVAIQAYNDLGSSAYSNIESFSIADVESVGGGTQIVAESCYNQIGIFFEDYDGFFSLTNVVRLNDDFTVFFNSFQEKITGIPQSQVKEVSEDLLEEFFNSHGIFFPTGLSFDDFDFIIEAFNITSLGDIPNDAEVCSFLGL